MRGWRNRQTRWIQVPVPARAWGFNSPLAHHWRRVSVGTKVPAGARLSLCVLVALRACVRACGRRACARGGRVRAHSGRACAHGPGPEGRGAGPREAPGGFPERFRNLRGFRSVVGGASAGRPTVIHLTWSERFFRQVERSSRHVSWAVERCARSRSVRGGCAGKGGPRRSLRGRGVPGALSLCVSPSARGVLITARRARLVAHRWSLTACCVPPAVCRVPRVGRAGRERSPGRAADVRRRGARRGPWPWPPPPPGPWSGTPRRAGRARTSPGCAAPS